MEDRARQEVEDLRSGIHNEYTKIYVDGCFDLVHSGHYHHIMKSKQRGDWLVAGINSDEDVMNHKGPTILNLDERAEILRHCKYVDEVVTKVPYAANIETLKSYGCQFYAHGDDPCLDEDGVDVMLDLRKAGMYIEIPRIAGISTTDITGRLLEKIDEP